MDFRKLATLVVALPACTAAFATGQEDDFITINGEAWGLMARPVCFDKTLYKAVKATLPDNLSINTANWDGFTGHWTVRNDSLFLDKITYDTYDKETEKLSRKEISPATLDSIFAAYKTPGGIHAAWVSGELRAGRGGLVRYVHSGFDRNVETENVMQVANGIVTSSRIYHNSVTPGISLYKVSDEVGKRFQWKKFPELAGKRLIFTISGCVLTPDGRLTDLKATLLRMGNEKVKITDGPVVEAFKDAMKSIFPWKTLHVYGKDMMEYEYFTMPVVEGKDGGGRR